MPRLAVVQSKSLVFFVAAGVDKRQHPLWGHVLRHDLRRRREDPRHIVTEGAPWSPSPSATWRGLGHRCSCLAHRSPLLHRGQHSRPRCLWSMTGDGSGLGSRPLLRRVGDGLGRRPSRVSRSTTPAKRSTIPATAARASTVTRPEREPYDTLKPLPRRSPGIPTSAARDGLDEVLLTSARFSAWQAPGSAPAGPRARR